MSKMSIAWVAVLVLASAAPAAAQTASGAFKAQPEGSITPKVAAAFVVRDQFNPRQSRIEVILSSTAVDVAKAVTELAPHTAVINDPALKDTNYILIWIGADGKVSMNATFSKTMTQFLERASADGTLRAELTANTPDKVAGRIFTPAPARTMSGGTYTADVTFSAPVVNGPPGKALPAGGGEPGKALQGFLAARQKKDWPALKAALSPSASERFVRSYNDDKENLADLLGTLEFWLPVKDATITGGTLAGDVAVLDVEGVMASGVKALTLVRVMRRPSGWLFDSAAMAGLLP